MKLTVADLAAMTDLSSVRAECDEAEIRQLAAAAKRHNCIAVFTLPGFTPLIRELLADAPPIRIGGVVGFPSGGDTSIAKAAQAADLVRLGCHELDMVINIGRLRSGRHEAVREDIQAVVDAAGALPVKVILECHYLTEEQIRVGCAMCVQAGASWVKTGTGWAPTGATPRNVAIMKRCVGDKLGVKAAGGVRTLETLVEIYQAGATRFGISLSSALKIFDQCAALPGGAVEFDWPQAAY
ncbi:MAG: deoxyribose-phosphate aldolase [Planctomycetota bacterium]|nr:deoxyribose-phosphate aldolase [Planctomycetota bacterium]